MNWQYLPVGVIILSACRDESFYQLNLRCIESLISSEPQTAFEIIIIETSANWTIQRFPYGNYINVRVIHDTGPFNYNRCLNVGLQSISSPIVLFSNNDVVYHPGWLSEIKKIKHQYPLIQSFSPFDKKSPYLSNTDFKKLFYPGYRVPIEFTGWCFVCESVIFNVTGKFDETFDLYFQDNDFARTLKQHGIIHAMVPASFVEHSGGVTTGISDASRSGKYQSDKQAYFSKWQKIKKTSLTQSIRINIKLLLLRLAATFH